MTSQLHNAETMPNIFFPHSCHLIENALGPCEKKSSAAHLTSRARSSSLSACYNLSMNVSGLLARATRHAEFLVSDERCVHVYTSACTCTCVLMYLGCPSFFFSHYRNPGVSPSTRGMLFLTGGGPWPRFFPLSPLRASVFSAFFSLFYRCTHYPPFCFRIGILFIFHGPWLATLANCPRASTLFHLIKGHKLPARPPYDDGGKKREEGKKKRTYRPQITRLTFSPWFSSQEGLKWHEKLITGHTTSIKSDGVETYCRVISLGARVYRKAINKDTLYGIISKLVKEPIKCQLFFNILYIVFTYHVSLLHNIQF